MENRWECVGASVVYWFLTKQGEDERTLQGDIMQCPEIAEVRCLLKGHIYLLETQTPHHVYCVKNRPWCFIVNIIKVCNTLHA